MSKQNKKKTLNSQSSHLFFKLLFMSISLYLFGKKHYLHPILDQGNNTKLLHQLFIITVYLWTKTNQTNKQVEPVADGHSAKQ